MAHDQLTLRLTPDAAKALDAACAAVGSAVPRHRLAVIALARGAAELAANPALIFGVTAAPSKPVETAAHPAPVLEEPKQPDAATARRRGRWGAAVPEADLAQLVSDLEAARAVGTLGAVLKASGAPTGNVHSWLKARRAGETGSMSAETYQKLRKALDAHKRGE